MGTSGLSMEVTPVTLSEKTDGGRGPGEIREYATMILGTDAHVIVGERLDKILETWRQGNDVLKKEEYAIPESQRRGIEHTHGQLMLFEHLKRLGQELDPMYITDPKTNEKVHVPSIYYAGHVAEAYIKINTASAELADKIADKLDRGKNHYLKLETRFQKYYMDIKFIKKNVNKPEIQELVTKSGEDGIESMVKKLLTDNGRGEIVIDGVNYDLEKMVRIVNQTNDNQKNLARFSLQTVVGYTKEGHRIPTDKNTLDLMRILVGMSTYHYFSKIDGNGVMGLIAAASARCDQMIFSAKPNTEADDFLKNNIDQIFGTEMLDIQRLEQNVGIYRRLTGYLMRGEITTNIIEVKTTTLDNTAKNSKHPDILGFKNGKDNVEDHYEKNLTHTAQAIIESFFGLGRLMKENDGVNFDDLTAILGIHENMKNKDKVMRNFKKFVFMFYEQKFMVARLFCPVFRKNYEGQTEIDETKLFRNNAKTFVDEISTWKIRKRLSQMYQDMQEAIKKTKLAN
jgi:hypothetical protein